MTNLQNWTPRSRPQRLVLEGRYVKLEPLDAARHGDALYEASRTEDRADRFRWLYDDPPENRVDFQSWIEAAAASVDPMHFAVIDRASGKIGGRQALMRMDPANGVVEIGSILWNPPVARMPAATEALYLFARYIFDELGYRRFEWKCNALNLPSCAAAERFGFTFEGIFRQHLVVKGENRDTAWFSMLDSEWPQKRAEFEAWLDPANFDANGRQKRSLGEIRAGLSS